MKLDGLTYGRRLRPWGYLLVALAFWSLIILIACLFVGRRKEKCAALVEIASIYEIRMDGKTLLSFAPDTLVTPGVWVNRWWLFPSCRGNLATYEARKDEGISNKNMVGWLQERLERNDSTLQGLLHIQEETRYFLRKHTVREEGYELVAKHAERVQQKIDSIQEMNLYLEEAMQNKHAELVQKRDFCVIYRQGDKLMREPCRLVNQSGNQIRLQTERKKKPAETKAISLWPWTKHIDERIYLTQYGMEGYEACKQGNVTNRITVERVNENLLPKSDGFSLIYDEIGLFYAGYMKNGKREGEGEMRDSMGRIIRGLFSNDTLYYGTRTDSLGHYWGDMDKQGKANGHGVHLSAENLLYEGKWSNDQRDGFGISISPNSRMQAGEWLQDTFKGERLVYTSERIYGIDISRYQHEKGRKKFAINWGNLRIKHLGTLSKKRVEGEMDYPVSFVYIKATEGQSLVNQYYDADYSQARKHGIPVGSYHFFSTHIPADVQADLFLSNAHIQDGDFPPVLDVEPSDAKIERMGGAEAMWASIRAWLNIVERRTGRLPVLYINQRFVNKYLPYAPDVEEKYPVWIARYGEYKPDVKLVYWQLSPDGRVNGIQGKVDINVFNGYREEFNEFKESLRSKR